MPGTVTDVAFTGLSTQYLIRTAWGLDLGVSTQNAGGETPLEPGASVLVAWRPEHTFPLTDGPAGARQAPSGLAGVSP